MLAVTIRAYYIHHLSLTFFFTAIDAHAYKRISIQPLIIRLYAAFIDIDDSFFGYRCYFFSILLPFAFPSYCYMKLKSVYNKAVGNI